MCSKDDVLKALSGIIDPDFGRDIVTLGFVKNIEIKGGSVSFTIELTTPACPVKDEFKRQAEAAVRVLEGVTAVNVTMTAMQKKERPGADINTLTKVGTVIAVSSCKGGVGKSTVAAHLARAIQREGHRVGLLDVDIYGPSLPTLMQTQRPEVRMKDQLIMPVTVDGLKTMSLGYMMGEKPAVMRGPMVSNYTMQLLKQTDWGDLDYLIIDMPPGTGDIQLTLVQQAALDGAIIVTTPQALSLVDVSRGILMFETVQVPVLGIVENMSYFVCDNCDKKHYLFGNSTHTLKSRFGLNVLAELPIIPGVSEAAKRNSGSNIPAFAALAEQLHREVGMRRMAAVNTPTVKLEKGYVCVHWADGMVSRIANKKLRVACQCALCVSEYTGENLLDPEKVSVDISADAVQPLGNYAVSISWSDGHSSGIFSWDRLREVAGLPTGK